MQQSNINKRNHKSPQATKETTKQALQIEIFSQRTQCIAYVPLAMARPPFPGTASHRLHRAAFL